MLFAAFWSAVNRGLRPRGTLYFLAAKSTKNSPADAFAYFVPSNVRNGRLFAGLQANRPRFLPLLAGTSFHGSGIGPGSFAAIPSFRPGKEANTRTCEHANRGEHLLFACSRRIPASPLEAVLNRRIIACSGTRTTAVFARKTSLYLFSAKSTDRSLRLVFFAAFWSAKSGAKTDPPTKKAERRGLTLAPGDYSRVCKQTVPSARAFSPPLS